MNKIVPVTLREAKRFICEHHRHNKPPTGWKFGIGVHNEHGNLVGVATAGRPIARHLDNGLTLEINRTCTDGTRNANSMLYGAVARAAKAMGYWRCITYTQHDEDGASLRAAGWVLVKALPARKSWAESSVKLRFCRDPIGNGGVGRNMWEIVFASNAPVNDPLLNAIHASKEFAAILLRSTTSRHAQRLPNSGAKARRA